MVAVPSAIVAAEGAVVRDKGCFSLFQNLRRIDGTDCSTDSVLGTSVIGCAATTLLKEADELRGAFVCPGARIGLGIVLGPDLNQFQGRSELNEE